jgi:hypothetical protein
VLGLAVAALVSGCGDAGGDDGPASCQSSLVHYYGAGCRFVDLDTNDTIPMNDMISACRQTLAESMSISCDRAIQGWVDCMADVPDPARSGADCDCSVAQEAILSDCT